MSLGLHEKCRQRLIEIITDLLPKIKVQNRMFLERRSAVFLLLAEPILPQNGPIKQRLEEQYISETPIFDFIYGTLSRELYENQKFDPESPSLALIEIEGYKEPNIIANRLIRDFESLPWHYCMTIKIESDLGKLFAKTINDYSIRDSVRLTTPIDDFSNKFPLTSGIEARDRDLSLGSLLMGFHPQQWDQLSTYIQVEVSGFIGKYVETAPVKEAISLLKAFCGIGIALRLFKVNHTYRPTPTKAKFFIHRRVGDDWAIEGVYELEAGLSNTFQDLIFHDLDGKLESEEAKIAWIKNRLDQIKCVFTNKKKSQKLIQASQWLFDSYCGENELLSFIQTTVVIEILLGEKAISDLVGLGELLRNRCAYLIGKSQKQRQSILKDFKEIYDVRSKIVHSGKNRLNMVERHLFSNLQWMCRRVIQEEVNLLQEDIKELNNNA